MYTPEESPTTRARSELINASHQHKQIEEQDLFYCVFALTPQLLIPSMLVLRASPARLFLSLPAESHLLSVGHRYARSFSLINTGATSSGRLLREETHHHHRYNEGEMRY